MNKLKYYVLDVFTESRYRGNQLAVVVCNENLEPAQYADIAREFGFSETSFIQLKDKRELIVRSFTPAGVEVGGAGHNLLGAVSLALITEPGGLHASDLHAVTMAGSQIGLAISKDNDNYLVNMKQQPARIITYIPASVIAPAIGLTVQDLELRGWKPAVVATEVPHLMIPVVTREALYKAEPNKQLLISISLEYGFEGHYLFTIPDAPEEYVAETRFFNPLIGIDEDAATGTAAGPLGGYLEQLGHIERDKIYRILQGVQVQHPSEIAVTIKSDGIWVGGKSVITMEGFLFL